MIATEGSNAGPADCISLPPNVIACGPVAPLFRRFFSSIFDEAMLRLGETITMERGA